MPIPVVITEELGSGAVVKVSFYPNSFGWPKLYSLWVEKDGKSSGELAFSEYNNPIYNNEVLNKIRVWDASN